MPAHLIGNDLRLLALTLLTKLKPFVLLLELVAFPAQAFGVQQSISVLTLSCMFGSTFRHVAAGAHVLAVVCPVRVGACGDRLSGDARRLLIERTCLVPWYPIRNV